MKTPPFPERNPPSAMIRREEGATLLVALIAMAVLALIATAALYDVGNRHAATFHSQSWNEALASAEVGADVGPNLFLRVLRVSAFSK